MKTSGEQGDTALDDSALNDSIIIKPYKKDIREIE